MMKIRFCRLYGPFKADTIVELTIDQALWFVRQGLAVKHVEKPAPVVKKTFGAKVK